MFSARRKEVENLNGPSLELPLKCCLTSNSKGLILLFPHFQISADLDPDEAYIRLLSDVVDKQPVLRATPTKTDGIFNKLTGLARFLDYLLLTT